MRIFIRECALTQMPESKIYRMEFDVTGDGAPELFLSSEDSKGVGGQEWCIYSPRSEEASYDYLGRLFFHMYGFRYDKDTGDFFIWFRHRASEGQVASLRIDATGFHSGSHGSPLLVSGEPEHEQEWEKFVKWRETVAIEIIYSEFDSFYEKGPVPWRYLSDKLVDHTVPSLRESKVMSSVERPEMPP